MGKASGVSRRRRKNQKPRFVHRSKLKKKAQATVKARTAKNKLIRDKWDPKRSVKSNLSSMGLVADPNKDLNQMDDENDNEANEVLQHLQKEANKPKQKKFRFSPEVIKFCVYMIEKYEDDYKAMERDKRNVYQESAGQIKKKINTFKSIPEHWDLYLNSKKNVDEIDV